MKLAFVLDRGTESILRFQTLFGNNSLLKDFKTFSPFYGMGGGEISQREERLVK